MERFLHEDFPEAKFYPERDCAVDHHVWNNLDLQLNHFRCRSEHEQKLLRDVYHRVNYNLKNGDPGFWKRQKTFIKYDQTASIIALSGYENQENFCQCGFHGYSCGDRVLYTRCCFTRLAGPAIMEFGGAFDARDEVYFIVLSFSGEPDERKRIIFKDLTKSELQQIKAQGCVAQGKISNYGIPFSGPEDALDARIYWDVLARSIREFTGRRKPLAGAFGGPELSVRFHPLGVLPHANYVAFSDGLTGDDVRALRRIVRGHLRGCRRIAHRLYPKVAVYRLVSKKDLREVIKYIFKPIAIAIPYGLSAHELKRDPAGMRSLNDDVNAFFDNMGIAFEGLVRMNRYGICSPSAGKKNYIGVVSEERLERRKVDAKRREAQQKEAEAIKKDFPKYKPHKRHKSEQDKYDLFLIRAYYRKALSDGEYPDKLPPRMKYLLRRATAVGKGATGNAPVASKQSRHGTGHPAPPAPTPTND
jgi:hypothetical protein